MSFFSFRFGIFWHWTFEDCKCWCLVCAAMNQTTNPRPSIIIFAFYSIFQFTLFIDRLRSFYDSCFETYVRIDFRARYFSQQHNRITIIIAKPIFEILLPIYHLNAPFRCCCCCLNISLFSAQFRSLEEWSASTVRWKPVPLKIAKHIRSFQFARNFISPFDKQTESICIYCSITSSNTILKELTACQWDHLIPTWSTSWACFFFFFAPVVSIA